MVRQGVCKLLKQEGDFDVVGEAENGREAVEMASALRPDVILMDIAMPVLNGLEATRKILDTNPAAKVVILSEDSDNYIVDRAIATGVAGFLEKQTSSAELVTKAIRAVIKGQAFFCQAIAKRWQDGQRKRLERDGLDKANEHHLTSRESEVLERVAEGSANKEIAHELGISIKTVEKHRQHVMDKLDIHETAGLTRYAIGAGFIKCSILDEARPRSQSADCTIRPQRESSGRTSIDE
jgi:DNA-binding NarL/FixJ family response regulator